MQERKSLPLDQFPREIQRAIMRFKTPRRGRKGYSEAAIQNTVYGIGHYLAVVQNVGLPLEISHEGLSVFIDSLDSRALRSSTRLTYLSAVQTVAKEVNYPAEKRRLILEDCEIYRSAMKKEVPTKVRKLAAKPITLRDIAKAAVEWRKKAQQTTNNRRQTYFQRSAFLALLSLTPLRLRDVNALEVGVHVIRQNEAWVLRVESSKTNFRHSGPLHYSLTPYLDDLLLYGEKGLCLTRYAERVGTRLFANHIDEPLSLRTLAAGFKVATGHSPHIVRTLVHDAMAVHGAHGSDIARVLCGQTSVQIAKVYEIHAERFRAEKAQEVLAEIQRRMPI
ncbi:hypothetical protein [Halocynthiibacter styelae]|uniref:Uncharacterized protein n=1 Tax=Halocynthiibacter styelae TaxID=2761955 RepID=A0A8J7ITE0_9RHOB|nr:hypothetical protein [Paenihalocynthiibacter styelae]MBI1492694.1 hypothetical protein [Paenihalocynthiibacter styelae]